MVQGLLVEFSIRLSAAATDNAANMLGAVRDLGCYQFGCAAHTLQLTVRESIFPIEPPLQKCRDITAFFHRSPQATETLTKLIKHFDHDATSFKIRIDVATRWNTLLFMLRDIIKFSQAISGALAALPSASVTALTETELKRIVELEKLLIT